MTSHSDLNVAVPGEALFERNGCVGAPVGLAASTVTSYITGLRQQADPLWITADVVHGQGAGKICLALDSGAG